MKPRISMNTLGVGDLGTSVRFYEDGLGLPRMDSPPEVAFFTLHGTWLGLYGREALAADAEVPADGNGFEAFALAHNVTSEAEVDAVMAQAAAAGATVVKGAAKGLVGWLRRLLQGSGRPPLGGDSQPPLLGRAQGRVGTQGRAGHGTRER